MSLPKISKFYEIWLFFDWWGLLDKNDNEIKINIKENECNNIFSSSIKYS
jgi:hypothetical protein